jgi:hypothetical protein
MFWVVGVGHGLGCVASAWGGLIQTVLRCGGRVDESLRVGGVGDGQHTLSLSEHCTLSRRMVFRLHIARFATNQEADEPSPA